MSKTLVEIFIESFKMPSKKIVLDFDATDDPDGVFSDKDIYFN